MAKQKYGRIENVPVMIMQKATKCYLKRKEIPKGHVCVISLIGGRTAVVKRTKIKGITSKYPKLKK